MCFGLTDRSAGPSNGSRISSTAVVPERRLPFASPSRASPTSADRVDFLRRASWLSSLSSCKGSLNDTVRIGFVIGYYAPYCSVIRRAALHEIPRLQRRQLFRFEFFKEIGRASCRERV